MKREKGKVRRREGERVKGKREIEGTEQGKDGKEERGKGRSQWSCASWVKGLGERKKTKKGHMSSSCLTACLGLGRIGAIS